MFILILAVSGLLKYCQRFFTPRIIAVILLLTPITLAPTILNLGFPATATDAVVSMGIISSTRAASRFPLIPTVGLLIVGSFFPDLLKLLLTIPNVVMATVLLFVMISQFAAGMQMLVGQNGIGTFDDGVIVAVPLLVALLISFTPAEVITQIPPMIRPICGNGFVMGVISLLIMEYVVFRK